MTDDKLQKERRLFVICYLLFVICHPLTSQCGIFTLAWDARASNQRLLQIRQTPWLEAYRHAMRSQETFGVSHGVLSKVENAGR